MQQPIVIVGAGAAGIGIGVLLKRLELPFVIIEQDVVGASFLRWPSETRFISPSFTGNAFGAVDLNAVTPDTSPAFSLRTEHPSGTEYARYLEDLVSHFKLPMRTGVKVHAIQYKTNDTYDYVLDTSLGKIGTNHLIWAAGEFQYPHHNKFMGADLCHHYADIRTWSDLEDDKFFVIGGYESGIDAAYQLVKLGKKVVLFDGSHQLQQHGSDSSYTLSPFTRQRFSEVANNIEVISDYVTSVSQEQDGFVIRTEKQGTFHSSVQPINCTGFASSLSLVKDLFEFADGEVQINDHDESTICPNLFLAGPQVKHGNAIFCFIYKYRQRFGIMGELLSKRLSGDPEIRQRIIAYYRDNQFYLKDLSCCEDECIC